MSTEPRFLVVDGYSRAGREDLAAGGASTAGELYRKMLEGLCAGCTVDMIYPADAGVGLPEGTALEQYDGLAWTGSRSEEHTSELQSLVNLVCRLLLEKKKPATSPSLVCCR